MENDGGHWDYLDKLVVDRYRKEIDQEENVWRTLPFFSATIAFELTLAFQSRPGFAGPVTGWTVAELAILSSLAVCLLLTLWFVWRSITPRTFSYLPPEPDIVAFVRAAERGQAESARPDGSAAASIHRILQLNLIDQAEIAADRNRRINQLRAQHRNRAGLFLIGSVLMLVALIGCDMAQSLQRRRSDQGRDTVPQSLGQSMQPGDAWRLRNYP